jgi:hypothetical protein
MTTPALNPLTTSRLALIRLLYIQAVDQTKLPVPLIYSAVLTFHDTVELFLGLSADHLGVSIQEHLPFTKYWEVLHPDKAGSRGVDLPTKQGMNRLNRLRNGFKHAGTLPGVPAVEQARAETTAFLEDATPLVFSIPFGDIDMADVAPQAKVRAKLKQARVENDSGARIGAMASLAEAFELVFMARTKPDWLRETPFSFGRDETYPPSERDYLRLGSHVDPGNRHDSHKITQEQFRVAEATRSLQIGMRVVALGIDYASYYRFRIMTPGVAHHHDGERRLYHAKAYAPRPEDFEWCYQFVIESALRVAEADAHVDGLPVEARAIGPV